MFRILQKNDISILLAVAAVLTVTLGCGLANKLRPSSNSQRTGDSINRPRGGQTPSGTPLFADKEQLAELRAALASAVGTDDLKLLDLTLYDDYAIAKVQDPNKPENVDSYTWRAGRLDKPVPVRLFGGGKLEDNLFSLKEVNIDGLPELTSEIMEKLKDVEGAKMTGYTIIRDLSFKREIEIHPLASGIRKGVYAIADKDAKLKEFEVR